LGRKPLHQKKKMEVSEDQEGCEQTSQQTTPDWDESEENALENVWFAQVCGHNEQNGHVT